MVVELFLRSGRNTGDNVRFGMAQNSPKHHCFRPDRPVWLDQKRSELSNFDRGLSVSGENDMPLVMLDQLGPPIIADEFARACNLSLISPQAISLNDG